MLKIGDIANYHSLIGGPITSAGHEITHIQLMPNNFGCDVAWISGKSGCVAMAALSNDAHPMQPRPKPLTRSQKRYQEFYHHDGYDSFADFIGVETRCEWERGKGYRFSDWRKRRTGPWKPTKKEAKAAYKELLKAEREERRMAA